MVRRQQATMVSVVLGLDLRGGAPLGDPGVWGLRDAASIAAFAFARKIRRFLVLDLACVGSEGGPPRGAPGPRQADAAQDEDG